MYTTNKFRKIESSTLYNKLASGKEELLGIAYNDLDYPTGVKPEVYIDELEFSKGEYLNFRNKVVAHDSDKKALEVYDSYLTDTGLGYVKTEQMTQGIYSPGLMTDLMLKGTRYSQVKKVDLVNTFIDPEVYRAVFTIAKDVKLELYKIKEYIVSEDKDSHEVYLLTANKEYDGQTLFGMLSRQDNLTKTDTEKLIQLLKYNNITCKEIPGVYVNSKNKDLTYNLYNTNSTGVFVLESEEKDRYSIACGQSFLSFLKSNIVNSNVEKIENNKYSFNINLKTGDTVSIFL